MSDTIKRLIEKVDRGEELTKEDLDAFEAEMPDTVECIRRTAEAAITWLTEVLPLWVDALTAAIQPALDMERIDTCPNKRVVHLARHAKKWRTRKKNRRRAFKILEKEAKR